ncbi:uncharacterized protein LOC131620167 [Vicia villosa]|uniref:uncharacterized protein LOC131620167 n=1 Tax=Vicia villosa TaxID=3911 RepID=UPI00273B1460|nr:uncharacterized protein LOC131620167 [Vicia villosa]
MGEYRVLQGESLQAFNEGIGYILNRWAALRTAVDFMWGGDNSHLKAQQLIADVCSWFAQSRGPFYIDDLKTLIYEGMNDAFDLEIFDGSDKDMAEEILAIREECLKGDFRYIDHLREASHIPNYYPHVEEVFEYPPPSPEDTERQDINSNESTIVDGTYDNNSDSETTSDSVNKPN